MSSRSRISAALSTAAAAAVLAFAGCGGGDGDDGGSGADPATAAPEGTSVYIEATIKPEGDLRTSVDELVKNATNGQIEPGRQIVESLNSELANEEDTEDLTYEDDIEPWLGEQLGFALQTFDGEEFEGYSVALQVTDSGAASDFFDRLKETNEDIGDEGSYEGYDYITDSDDDTVLGVGDDFFILGQNLKDFKAAVDATTGDSLDSDSKFTETFDRVPEGSIGDVYVDIGGLIEQSGEAVDPEVLRFYNALGVDFSDATALASVVPTSDSLELDFSTDATGSMMTGDPSELLSSFPSNSLAAFASAGVGEQIQTALNGINEVGFPPEVPKGALFQTLNNAGVDVKAITSKIGDVGLFVNGTGLSDLGGALVVTTDSAKTAKDTVSQLTNLLRQSQAPGFSLLKGGAGFQITDEELPRPLVVTSKGDSVLAGLGLPQTLQAVSGGGRTLADNPRFTAAQDALGGSTISGFIDIEPLIPFARLAGDEIAPALPYLENLSYMVFGQDTDGEFATSKVILALGE